MLAKAIVFDIDGTLTEEHSWTALTRDLGASVEDHLKIYDDMRAGLIDLAAAEVQLCDVWRATGRATKANIMNFFESWPLRNDALDVVAKLKDSGYKICLITGFTDLYAEYIAAQLDVTDYYANTHMSFNDDGQLVSFSYKPNQAEVKLEQLQEFCNRQNIQVTDCVAVGNGENDVELFIATHNGILIDPNNAPQYVRDAARATIDSLSDILKLTRRSS